MKVSYITLHYISNYGSVLQTYATQEIFKKIGLDAECVNYVRDNCSTSLKRALYTYNENVYRKSFVRKVVYCLYYLLSDIQRYRIFASFIHKNVKLSKKYSSYEGLMSHPPKADIYCTGSDQTWNSIYNGGIEPAYYLQYAPAGKKKIALAASFGTESVNIEEYEEIKKLIHQYHHISVRELSAKKILDEMDYPSAEVILDPTLLIEKNEWKKLFLNRKFLYKKYILVFALNKNPLIDASATKISELFGLPIIRVSFSMKDMFKKNHIYMPAVGYLLSYIDNAEFILTDSFHGTAFSINFEKQVFVVYPEHHNTRLKSILQITECLHRVLTPDDIDIANIRPIDYIKVNETILKERKRSFEFLERACQSEVL